MFAVVYLPRFELQAALRHEPELWSKPVALVDPALNTPRVCAVTEAAEEMAVTIGLTPTQAMARARQIVVRHRSPEQEKAVTNALLQCAYGFSPYIENTAPGICTLDLRGLAELKEANETALANWVARFRAVITALNLHACIGIGATPMVAQHAARWTSSISIVADTNEFMRELPVAALNPSSDVVITFSKWGIRTVGEMLALGQPELVERIGLEALALFAATTESIRPLNIVRPPEHFEESHEFEDGIETLEPLLFLMRRFVDQLGTRLEQFGKVAELLVLRLKLDNGQVIERRLRVPQPTHHRDILFRMLHTHLETLRTESPVTAVSLGIESCAPEQKQFGLFETALRDPHQFQETLARLTGLLGADRVGTPVRENSHRPDAFKLVPPDFENAPDVLASSKPLILQRLPLRCLRPPVKAAVRVDSTESTTSTEVPISLQCSVASGTLKIALGPWRSSGNWWEPGGWQREEWDAATHDGKTFRLSRKPEGWFVENILD